MGLGAEQGWHNLLSTTIVVDGVSVVATERGNQNVALASELMVAVRNDVGSPDTIAYTIDTAMLSIASDKYFPVYSNLALDAGDIEIITFPIVGAADAEGQAAGDGRFKVTVHRYDASGTQFEIAAFPIVTGFGSPALYSPTLFETLRVSIDPAVTVGSYPVQAGVLIRA